MSIDDLIQLRDVTGRISRTMTTAQIVAVLGALQVGLPLVGVHVPAEYQWAYGAVMCSLGVWLAYLRSDTNTAMK